MSYICRVICSWRYPKRTKRPGHYSRALTYQAPGIFQGTYESKESFEPIVAHVCVDLRTYANACV